MFLKSRVPVFIVFLALGGSASVAKSSGYFLPQFSFIEHFVGGHRYLHLIVVTTLSFLAVWSTSVEAKKYIFSLLGLPNFVLLAMVISDELLQYYLPFRHFSLIDMSVNIFSVIFGILIYTSISFIKQKTVTLFQ